MEVPLYTPVKGLQSEAEPSHNGGLYQISYIPFVLGPLITDAQLGRKT
jgi:hypothetical protein